MSGTPTEIMRYWGDYDRMPYFSPWTLFHELQVSELSPLISLDSSNGLSEIERDTLEGSGTGGGIELVDGEIRLNTGTDANAWRRLTTKERGRYQVGIQAVAGEAVRRPVRPTGDADMWWELGDATDAVRIGDDATGYYARIRRNTSIGPKLYQKDWNVDPLDGTGPSGIEIDLRFMTVFRRPFGYYGVGPDGFGIFRLGDKGQPQFVLAHYFTQEQDAISMTNPKLPLRQYVDNGTTGVDLELFVGGRHFSVHGKYEPNRKTTPEAFARRSVSASTEAIIGSMRKKSARQFTTRSCKISQFGGTSSQVGRFRVYLGSTLAGTPNPGSLTDVPDAETAMELDTAATGRSGGKLLRAIPVAGGQGNAPGTPGIESLGVDIPEDSWVTLTFENLSGNSADVDPYLEIEEEA